MPSVFVSLGAFFLASVVIHSRSSRVGNMCIVEPNALYDADSFDADTNVWEDLSGNGHDADVTNGDSMGTGSFTQFGKPYLTGTQSVEMTFPISLGNDYTFFSVASYAVDADNRGRIFQSADTTNWLSGFWNTRVGIAHHDGWLRLDQSPTVSPSDWVFSADQADFYHATGYNDATGAITETDPVVADFNGINSQVSVNRGTYGNEDSDFNIAELMMFDSVLTTEQIQCVEGYLLDKYTTEDVCGSLDIDGYLETCSALDISSLLTLREEFEELRETLANGPAAQAQAGNFLLSSPASDWSWAQFAVAILVAVNVFFCVATIHLVRRVSQLTSNQSAGRVKYALTSVDSDSDCETRVLRK